jgi:methylmalonyl-CoA/ethylmalonyl-CoA epimerase
VLYEGIDHVVLPVSDVAAACDPFECLGLVVSPVRHNAARGTTFRQIPVGGDGNQFFVEVLSADGLHGIDRGLSTVVLRVPDVSTVVAALRERGIQATVETIATASGMKVCDRALLPDLPDAATRLILVQYVQSQPERHAYFASLGQHATPLKRLDHLAAVAPDLERSCRFWDEVLGVPTVGEVVSPTVVVRQLRIGDAMFELLGPATTDSPIRQRPPGLNSMCSFEVPDLDATVAHVEASGLTVVERRIGTLPGTIVATVPGAQMSGLNVQLLQYV